MDNRPIGVGPIDPQEEQKDYKTPTNVRRYPQDILMANQKFLMKRALNEVGTPVQRTDVGKRGE